MKKHPIDKLIERLELPIKSGIDHALDALEVANTDRADAAAHLRRLNTTGFFCAHCTAGPMTPDGVAEHVGKCANNPQVKTIAELEATLRDIGEAVGVETDMILKTLTGAS